MTSQLSIDLYTLPVALCFASVFRLAKWRQLIVTSGFRLLLSTQSCTCHSCSQDLLSERPENFRPISLLSLLCKILEKHVCNKLIEFIDENNLLSNSQWGFRSGRSTVSALVSSTSTWLADLDTGKDICSIFFDYKKAFDSVPHRPLLDKLITLDFDMHLVHWISGYLTDRTQRVVVDGEISSAAPVLSGVPQGSVIGPLLFLVYVDGVNSISTSSGSSISLYADDLMLSTKPISSTTDISSVQQDVDAIQQWSTDNYLTLNLSKGKYMLISKKKHSSHLYALLL